MWAFFYVSYRTYVLLIVWENDIMLVTERTFENSIYWWITNVSQILLKHQDDTLS